MSTVERPPESFLVLAKRRLPRLRERAEYLQARIREKEAGGWSTGFLKAELSALLWAVGELAEKEELHRAEGSDQRQSFKRCGLRDGWWFRVDDRTWAYIVPPELRDLALCLGCFDSLAGDRGYLIERVGHSSGLELPVAPIEVRP